MPLKLFDFNQPITLLIKVFIAWKAFLLLLAVCSPGPGYDTSTSLLLSTFQYANATRSSGVASHLSERLTRWDAIYFTKVAERGYLFEQEWAFGWGWTRLISLISCALKGVGIVRNVDLPVESLAGILIAHISHGLSVLVLYNLTFQVFTGPVAAPQESKKLALITALLHIISPAGLFLSAPYAESTFALLSFSGYYLFIRSTGESALSKDFSLILAGALFGVSTTIRSNGLLNGIIFAEEAARNLLSFKIRRLLAAGLGGALVGLGFIIPQIIAYQQFCAATEGVGREWCTRTIPSIYSFVQTHYWKGNGLFQYWTVSNIPLFLLAAPMLSVLALSSTWCIKSQRLQIRKSDVGKKQAKVTKDNDADSVARIQAVRVMSTIQAVLGLMTFLNAHVQIVTRLASGYPVWYWWIASKIMERGEGKTSRGLVRWMVMYGMIQGGLFASFLPPA